MTILSPIFRSKSQESRDLTRDTPNRIAGILGSSHLSDHSRVKSCLVRGPQLHVLAYVTHSLMEHVTTREHADIFSTLDDCVNDVTFVPTEVIFGGCPDGRLQDQDERSSSVVFEKLGLICDTSQIYYPPKKFSSLLPPLKTIMQETSSIKVMNLVEEILKWLTVGLNGNLHLVPSELSVTVLIILLSAKIFATNPSSSKA